MTYFVWGIFVASEPIRIPGVIKFGEDFDFDFSAYTLRRSGRILKLERIPAEVLAILVENRGQIVSRENIAEKIWGKDVFLDTDNSINGAIRKIRQVLKDDPEQPRFIQTVTGKGYCFVAAVVAPDVAPIEAPVAGPPPEPAAAAPPSVREDQVAPSPRRRALWIPILAMVFFLIAAWS